MADGRQSSNSVGRGVRSGPHRSGSQRGASGGTTTTVYYTMLGRWGGAPWAWTVTGAPDYAGALSGKVPVPTDISLAGKVEV